MRYSFQTLLFLLLVPITCLLAQPQDGYQIEGHIKGLADNSKIYLINGGQRKTIDSTLVQNERFLLTGQLDEPAHTYLYSGKSTKLADILLDNRPIKIQGSYPVYDSVQVSGSDIDKEWREWYALDQGIGYKHYLLKKEREALLLKKDTANASLLTRKINQLTTDRILLLKTYVKRYGDKASGALIATLCTAPKELTREDYLQLYQSLSPAMQQTRFGTEILTQSKKSKPTRKSGQ
jgi:hypothetical protein